MKISILLIYFVYMVSAVYCYLVVNDGTYTDKVVFTLNQKDDPREWLCKKYPDFKCDNITKILDTGKRVFYRAILDQSKRTKAIRKDVEDSVVKQYRHSDDFLWIEQEVEHIRVAKTTDPEWPNLWHLNDNVSPSMKVNEAWTAGYTGQNILIAVLDDGLQTDHPDLDANVDTANDIDINGGDNNPYPPSSSDSHGTNVGGLIAAERDNNDCTVGVAYQSKILGVRILGGLITDSQEAQALGHHISNVDIYSNSWGPTDGYGFSGPGTVTKAALENGVTNGRGGKGAIYTWASGNGGTSDNCNGDGYVNSIYTIGITSVQDGEEAWYSEVCAAALAATYGGSSDDRYLTTTTTSSGCTNDGVQGTSFSTPIASGIIALALHANPNLTWRDIQHLIVLTSKRNGFSDTYTDWKTNGKGKEFSQVLGFGLMDAEAMVNRSVSWTSVPTQTTCSSSPFTGSGSTTSSLWSSDSRTVSQSDCTTATVTYLEHVTVDITFSYSRYRGTTYIYLVSPSGTESRLLTYRYDDAIKFSSSGSKAWTFMSVHFWRESPVGTWTLKFKSHSGFSVVTIDSWSLTFYGTSTDPLADIDLCESSPCQNNGTCANFAYYYTCQCADGYTGTNCDSAESNIDVCESSPCQNNGTCTNFAYYYTCQCADGYTGTNCDQTELTIHSSLTTGFYTESTATYSSLTTGFYTDTDDSGIKTTLIVGISVAVPLLFIFIIIVIVKSVGTKAATVGVTSSTVSATSTSIPPGSSIIRNYPPPSYPYSNRSTAAATATSIPPGNSIIPNYPPPSYPYSNHSTAAAASTSIPPGNSISRNYPPPSYPYSNHSTAAATSTSVPPGNSIIPNNPPPPYSYSNHSTAAATSTSIPPGNSISRNYPAPSYPYSNHKF